MPLWATLTIAILSSGLLGTVVGALMQARRERKRAVHNFAMAEVTEFANAARGWFDAVGAAIRARDEQAGDEDTLFSAADVAVKDAGRLVGRLVIAVGGAKVPVAATALGIVSVLELAVEELREWPPDVEDDALEDVEAMTEEERDREYALAWELTVEDRIDEATMWLDFARTGFAKFFTPAAVRHLDPKVLDRAREIMPTVPPTVKHPIKTRRRKAQQRRALAEHHAELARLREEHAARAARARAAMEERASSDAATD